MAHFDDIVLPVWIRQGSQGGPSMSRQQLVTTSGYRKTNELWSQKLRQYTFVYGPQLVSRMYELLEIFEAVGTDDSFLARDWHDWNTTQGSMLKPDGSKVTARDQPLQNTADNSFVGDGSTTVFQLVKRYVKGSASHTRTIQKPVNGTILISVDGATQTEGVDYTIDYSTGRVTFTTAPGSVGSPTAVKVQWGGEFYVPVQFADADFSQNIAGYNINTATIAFVEVRL